MENMKPDNKRKILILSAFLCLLVDAAVSVPLAHRHSRGEYASASAACGPDLCLSTSLAAGGPLGKGGDLIRYAKSALKKVGNMPARKAKEMFVKMEQSAKGRRLSAIADCSLMAVDIASQIDDSKEIIIDFIKTKNYSMLGARKYDLYNLLSGAQTNAATCIDGFSRSRTPKMELAAVKAKLSMTTHATTKLMTIADRLSKTVEVNVTVRRRTGEEWPEWLSAGDRRLLLEPAVEANVTVAADGTGDYRTVSEAVAAWPAKSGERYVIRVKAGEYRENVVIPRKKTNLMFVGDGQKNTIITASKNGDTNTSFNSATVGQF